MVAPIVLVSCKRHLSNTEIENLVKEGFTEQTQYAVSNVEVIRKGDYQYEGLVTLEKDNSKAQVEINIDRDDPSKFIWKVTAPSQTMINDAFEKANAVAQTKLDSIVHELEITAVPAPGFDTTTVLPESDDH